MKVVETYPKLCKEQITDYVYISICSYFADTDCGHSTADYLLHSPSIANKSLDLHSNENNQDSFLPPETINVT